MAVMAGMMASMKTVMVGMMASMKGAMAGMVASMKAASIAGLYKFPLRTQLVAHHHRVYP